jgi:hypothetical protein
VPEKYRKTEYRPIINEVRKANPHLQHIISVRGDEDKSFVRLEDLIQAYP